MKNRLIDLNDHLFNEIEHLADKDIKGEELKEQLQRSKAIAHISDKIISNARLMLDSQKTLTSGQMEDTPEMFMPKKRAITNV